MTFKINRLYYLLSRDDRKKLLIQGLNDDFAEDVIIPAHMDLYGVLDV